MRLFFALWPDARVRDELTCWARACRPSSRGRLVRRENLHVTLAFVGEVDAGQASRLDTVGDHLPAEGFDLVFDHVGYWHRNRIVYAGASRTPEALARLAGRLTQQLKSEGYVVDPRPYVAHATLLRDSAGAPEAPARAPLQWRVREVALVESVRQRGAVAYLPRRRWTLAV